MQTLLSRGDSHNMHCNKEHAMNYETSLRASPSSVGDSDYVYSIKPVMRRADIVSSGRVGDIASPPRIEAAQCPDRQALAKDWRHQCSEMSSNPLLKRAVEATAQDSRDDDAEELRRRQQSGKRRRAVGETVQRWRRARLRLHRSSTAKRHAQAPHGNTEEKLKLKPS